MPIELTERGIGTEIIQLRIAVALYNELNDEIDKQQDLWLQRDEEWNTLTGQEPRVVLVEYVESENYHRGHRPSLVEQLPQPNYPNISVMSYSGKPTTQIIDQATNYTIISDIEVMVKGDFEAEVDTRIHRTVEAIHQVLVRNEKLGGASMGWDNDPLIQITDIFKRREEMGQGKDWYWQAARIRYNLTRHTNLPEEV